MAGLLVVFWFLFTDRRPDWVAVAFYIVGLILGILLISQFWTLANDIYDPRQAKRLFGFIGGGASLGGIAGAALTAFLVEDGRREQHAAGERAIMWRLRRRSCCRASAREKPPARSDATQDRRGRRRQRRRGHRAAARRRGTCRSSRW